MAIVKKRSVWTKLRGLSMAEWRTLIVAVILLPVIDAALILWGFRRVYAVMNRLSPSPDPESDGLSLEQALQMGRIVNVAARRGLRTVTCLRRSMLLWWLLRWHGRAAELSIGVRFEGEKFLAHAWVEHNGIVLNDRADIGERFATFEQISSLSGATWV